MTERRFLRNDKASSAFAHRWEGRDRPMSANPRDNQRDAGRWRRLEAEARLIALTMGDADRQRVMLFIAESYKLLAQRRSCARLPKNDWGRSENTAFTGWNFVSASDVCPS